MMKEFSPELRRELLDDFYAECDEQLRAIWGALTELEAGGAAQPTAVAIETVFRNLHSLKGNAAIVGLREGETLAHAAEDLLRVLVPQGTTVSTDGLQVLHDTAHRLERMVSAHRNKQPLPAIDDLIARLTALGAEYRGETQPTIAAPSGSGVSEGSAPPAPGKRWRFTFSPSRELDQRGVNINTVRARLSALGKVVQATPLVRPGGAMTFEFIVELPQPPDASENWSSEGVSFEAIEETTTAPGLKVAGDHATAFFVAPSHIVRVELGRLDELMRIAGELVIHRSRLEDRLNQPDADKGSLKEVNLALTRSLAELRRAITSVRLVPMAEIFTRMPFVVRDLGRESGKKVRLLVEGQQTEVDKYLVERLKEPLLHLVRNAFSHGIETPDERLAAGKPAEASIQLSAKTVGESVMIQVRDDGRGVDVRRVAARATALGLPVPESTDSAGLLNLLCTPGFSTRTEVDRASGRGVGMAVVQNAVRELGGTLELHTVPGKETRFTLRLPVTLSIVNTFLVNIGTETCAVPQTFVEEIIEFSQDQIHTIKGVEVISYRDGVLPLLRLNQLFAAPGSARPRLPVLVISSERGCTGLVVDSVRGQREVVVRPMNDPFLQVTGVAGATELGDGRPVLILDPLALTSGVVRPTESLSRDSAALHPDPA